MARIIALNHMFHHLYIPPSIPLSFNLAVVLLRRNALYRYEFPECTTTNVTAVLPHHNLLRLATRCGFPREGAHDAAWAPLAAALTPVNALYLLTSNTGIPEAVSLCIELAARGRLDALQNLEGIVSGYPTDAECDLIV